LETNIIHQKLESACLLYPHGPLRIIVSAGAPIIVHGGTDATLMEEGKPTTSRDVMQMQTKLVGLNNTPQYQQLYADGHLHTAVSVPDLGRFNASCIIQRSVPSFVFRRVSASSEIPSLTIDIEKDFFTNWLASPARGIISLNGDSARTISTVAAAILKQWSLRENWQHRAVTIEQPICYLQNSTNKIIDQIEIGVDAKNLETALKGVAPQEPDIVFIDDMDVISENAVDVIGRLVRQGTICLLAAPTYRSFRKLSREDAVLNSVIGSVHASHNGQGYQLALAQAGIV
jgi:Tfp pilus assembly ATPase PilU